MAAPSRLPAKAARLSVAFLFLGSCTSFFGSSIPQREGTLAVAGLSSPVEVVRDRYGIPHIAAANGNDLYFAQGFCHAQDRLFQMDLGRRLGRGELSEIFGEAALPADRLFRHLGFGHRASILVASLPAGTLAAAQAYCDGANAGMKSLRAWPAEFRLLGYAPRPFMVEDIAAAGLLNSFGLAQWGDEAVLYRIAKVLPREKAEELFPRVPPDALVVVPGFDEGSSKRRLPAGRSLPDPAVLLEGLSSLAALGIDLPRSAGSNAWAVSGDRSVTGLPILANDPHLPFSYPSLWYENHLTAPGLDVYGVTFPGIPGVVIGHNPRIAWGFTNSMLDDADFFIERVDGNRVMYRKKWIPLVLREERIRVKGGGVETVTVRETPHGPILSPVLVGVGEALSLRWTGFDGGDQLGALFRLNRAGNREEFLAALSLHPHPAQNVVYADAAGNIGVVMAGRVPVRKGGATLLPVPGDTGEWEWTGYVPFEENPAVWNPGKGVVAAANFPTAGPSFPRYLSRIYEPSDRGRRILEVLAGGEARGEKHSVASFERLQSDVRAPGAAKAVALALRAARSRSRDSEDLAEAERILSSWDLSVTTESRGALLYEVYYERLMENVFRDALGPALYGEFSSTSILAWNAMDRVIGRGGSLFLENLPAGRKDPMEEVAARSLQEAMSFLRDRLGNARSIWTWGRVHQVTFRHPFGKKWYLRDWFDIGPYGAPGDGRTVFMERFQPGTGYSVAVGPSMRQVVPLGFRSMARSVIPTGASGHFFEPHYNDQTLLWYGGRTHPAWTDRGSILENAESRLRLVPSTSSGTRRNPLLPIRGCRRASPRGCRTPR
jgi:penicillin G amidase